MFADETLAPGGQSSTWKWTLSDRQGTVRNVFQTTPTTGLVNHKKYDAYGNLVSETNPAAAADVLFGYTGREFDAETGLQYNRARYYDPHSGRFISSDPIGFASGDANRYRYVGNNPVNATDPTGLASRMLGNSSGPSIFGSLGSAVGSTISEMASSVLDGWATTYGVAAAVTRNVNGLLAYENRALAHRAQVDRIIGPGDVTTLSDYKVKQLVSSQLATESTVGGYDGGTQYAHIDYPRLFSRNAPWGTVSYSHPTGGFSLSRLFEPRFAPYALDSVRFGADASTVASGYEQLSDRMHADVMAGRGAVIKLQAGILSVPTGPVGWVLGADQAISGVHDIATRRSNDSPLTMTAAHGFMAAGYDETTALSYGRRTMEVGALIGVARSAATQVRANYSQPTWGGYREGIMRVQQLSMRSPHYRELRPTISLPRECCCIKRLICGVQFQSQYWIRFLLDSDWLAIILRIAVSLVAQ